MTMVLDIATTLLAYSPLVLALVLFLGGLGVPVPGTMLLLAAGAFSSRGLLNGPLTALLALVAVVLGDVGSYLLGRSGGFLFRQRLEGSLSWHRAERAFERWGSFAIVLSRFLFTPLALPTNLIAGGERYHFRRFLGLCLLGEALWVALCCGLGYLFAEIWEDVGVMVSDMVWWLVGAVLAAVGAYEVYECCRHYATRAATGPAKAASDGRRRRES